MRIKLYESFSLDSDIEMIFVYLYDEGIKTEFGETDDSKYVDIIRPEINNIKLNLSNLAYDPILNWIDMCISDNDDWYLETKGAYSSRLNKNNIIHSKEYLLDLLDLNTDIRVIIKKDQKNIEQFFKPDFKDFHINYDYKKEIIYITKNFNYNEFFHKKRREVRISYKNIISEYKYPGVLNINTRKYQPISKEPDTYQRIYKSITSCVEKLPEYMRDKCELTVKGKSHIELSLNTKTIF